MCWTVTLSLLQGMRQAAVLFGLTLAFSLPLGLPVALGSMSRCRPVRAVFDALVWVIRGTPLVLQLIIIFYGPGLWFGHNIWGSNRMLACTVAFVLNYACYFSVIYRGGIQAVPAGQREAAQVLGLTRRQIFFKITLLQVVKRILPPMSNEIITLVKDTSLARSIAIVELTKAGEDYVKTAGITWPLFYTGVYYLLFVGLLTLLFRCRCGGFDVFFGLRFGLGNVQAFHTAPVGIGFDLGGRCLREDVLLHGVGQLTTRLVADIAGRCAKQLLVGMALPVFAHVKADAGGFVAENLFCERLGGFGLARAGRRLGDDGFPL